MFLLFYFLRKTLPVIAHAVTAIVLTRATQTPAPTFNVSVPATASWLNAEFAQIINTTPKMVVTTLKMIVPIPGPFLKSATSETIAPIKPKTETAKLKIIVAPYAEASSDSAKPRAVISLSAASRSDFSADNIAGYRADDRKNKTGR